MTKMITRRQALQGMGAAGIGAVMVGLYTWRVEPHWLEFTHPVLPIAGLPRELEGRTLAQLSDLHVGPKVDDDYILESFRRVQQLAPDIVVYTGDWITYRTKGQFEQLRRVMAHAPHGRLGTIGILGNHDYGLGWRMADVAEEVTGIVRAAGVTLLRNEAVDVAGLQFLDSTTCGGCGSILWNCSRAKAKTRRRLCSATTRMPRTTRFGAVIRAGFLRVIRMGGSVSRRSCRHRFCR